MSFIESSMWLRYLRRRGPVFVRDRERCRGLLFSFRGTAIVLVVLAHPELPFEVLESEDAHARRAWLKAA